MADIRISSPFLMTVGDTMCLFCGLFNNFALHLRKLVLGGFVVKVVMVEAREPLAQFDSNGFPQLNAY